MTDQLPEFEGTVPVGVLTSVTGTSQRISRPIHLGEKVVLLVEAEVGQIGHKVGKDGLKRHQALVAADVWELADGEATDLLRALRTSARLEADAAMGVAGLPFDDTVVAAQYTTAGGTVMTPAEIAEHRGEDWDPGDELTVVLRAGGDNVKAFWPDDWAGTGQSLAGVGGFMRVPGGEPGETGQVVLLLDADSGEVIAEWTDEDEEARELAEAAREDRAAMAELEAARAGGDEPDAAGTGERDDWGDE